MPYFDIDAENKVFACDEAFGWPRLSKSAASGGTITLTTSEAGNRIIELTGALPNNTSIVLPLKLGAIWTIYNGTSGDFTLTIKGATGTGVVVQQGRRMDVYCDGTNIMPCVSDPSVIGAIPNGRLAKATADANVTLTKAEAAYRSLEFTGAMTTGRTVTFPGAGEWVVYNNTTGGFSLTLACSGTTVTLAATKRMIVECDGANMIQVTAAYP